MKNMNSRIIMQLKEEVKRLEFLVDSLYNYIAEKETELFKLFYPMYREQVKKCEQLANCGYVYPEIEEYARKLERDSKICIVIIIAE